MRTYAAVAGKSFSKSKPSNPATKLLMARLFQLYCSQFSPNAKANLHVCSRCEGDISNGDLASNEPLLFGQNGLEHSEDTENLPLVSFNSGRDLLSVVDGEPCNLSKVRSTHEMANQKAMVTESSERNIAYP